MLHQPERTQTLSIRRAISYGFGLILLLAALGVTALVLLGPFDLAGPVARQATRALGRPVTIATLRLKVGTSVTVALGDLVIGDAEGGGPEPFLTLGRLDAEIASWSLVGWALFGHGPTMRHLSVEHIALSMRHGTDGRPNWHFGQDRSDADLRIGFPTQLDARLVDGVLDFHTSLGNRLRVRVATATIAAKAADQPVALAVDGTYNDQPIRIDGTLASFDNLHDPSAPFAAKVHMTSDDTMVDFDGTMTRPIGADGAEGQVRVTAPGLDRLLALAGVGGQAPLPLTLTAAMSRDRDLWRLTDARGTLSAQPFHLTAQLQEGARLAPDAFTLDAVFSVLDLTLLGGQDTAGDTLLRIDDAPGTRLDAHIQAQQIIDGDLRADAVDLTASLSPGAFSLAPLTMRFAGGEARIDASLLNAQSGAAARLDAHLTGADPAQLSRVLGLGALPITGAVTLRAGFDSTGVKVDDAARSTNGGLVLSMRDGTVARNLLEQASTDMRQLFRKADGVAQIRCLLGVVDFEAGIGRIAPLRLKTSDGTLIAEGTLDLRRDQIDVTLATEAATTSAFALDVPVRLAGPIRNPHALPSATRPGGSGDLGRLAPPLQEFARANPCAAR